MFVEEMSWLFRRVDSSMSEEKKVRLLMRGVKEQLFAGLVRNRPVIVAEFLCQATFMERALRQRSSKFERLIAIETHLEMHNRHKNAFGVLSGPGRSLVFKFRSIDTLPDSNNVRVKVT